MVGFVDNFLRAGSKQASRLTAARVFSSADYDKATFRGKVDLRDVVRRPDDRDEDSCMPGHPSVTRQLCHGRQEVGHAAPPPCPRLPALELTD